MFEQSTNEDPAVLASRLIHRAHLQDGLPELSIGIMGLLLAASFWVEVLLTPSFLMTGLYLILTIAFIALCIGSTALVRRIRRQYLIERVGYVEARQDEPGKLRRRRKLLAVLFASLALLLAIMAMDLLDVLHLDQSIMIFLGTVFCGACLSFGTAYRFKVNGIFALITGLLLAIRVTPLQTGIASFFTVIGSMNLISGLLVFFRFMRQTGEDARA